MCWLERLNYELIRQGHKKGPACCDEEGSLAQVSQYQEMFVHFLTKIQQEHPGIIFGGCKCWVELYHGKVI